MLFSPMERMHTKILSLIALVPIFTKKLAAVHLMYRYT